jgi:hypothetical protein
MDGGSDSKLIHWDTFGRLKIGIDKLHPPRGLITGIVCNTLKFDLVLKIAKNLNFSKFA